MIAIQEDKLVARRRRHLAAAAGAGAARRPRRPRARAAAATGTAACGEPAGAADLHGLAARAAARPVRRRAGRRAFRRPLRAQRRPSCVAACASSRSGATTCARAPRDLRRRHRALARAALDGIAPPRRRIEAGGGARASPVHRHACSTPCRCCATRLDPLPLRRRHAHPQPRAPRIRGPRPVRGRARRRPRAIYDFADLDNSRFATPLGQSGNILSPGPATSSRAGSRCATSRSTAPAPRMPAPPSAH